ncbi:hypothetical protein OE903_14150 [Bacillus sp. B6(2022)]|nr:hypothetical protein [Bacillus sp. B6(2022)]
MKPSTINQTSIHESMDAILQDVTTTILQTNEIERFAVFHVKKPFDRGRITSLIYFSTSTLSRGPQRKRYRRKRLYLLWSTCRPLFPMEGISTSHKAHRPYRKS